MSGDYGGWGKHCSPIHSNLEALVAQCVVGHRCEELGPFCWPMPAADFAGLGTSHWFAEHTSQMWWFCFTGIQKAVVIRPAMDHHGDHELWYKFDWRTALALLLGPTTDLAIAGCHIQSTFHQTAQSDQEMVHCCCVE